MFGVLAGFCPPNKLGVVLDEGGARDRLPVAKLIVVGGGAAGVVVPKGVVLLAGAGELIERPIVPGVEEELENKPPAPAGLFNVVPLNEFVCEFDAFAAPKIFCGV